MVGFLFFNYSTIIFRELTGIVATMKQELDVIFPKDQRKILEIKNIATKCKT